MMFLILLQSSNMHSELSINSNNEFYESEVLGQIEPFGNEYVIDLYKWNKVISQSSPIKGSHMVSPQKSGRSQSSGQFS